MVRFSSYLLRQPFVIFLFTTDMILIIWGIHNSENSMEHQMVVCIVDLDSFRIITPVVDTFVTGLEQMGAWRATGRN